MSDLLLALRKEMEWAKEGTPRPEGDPYVSYGTFPDWTGSSRLTFTPEFADTAAIIVDGRLYFGDELAELERPNFLPERNPRYVAFRVIDPETGRRQSMVVLREDTAPSPADISNAIGSTIFDPEAARIRAAAHAAVAPSAESTRARGGKD